jgi:threonine dehydrogenase-like Zn-dependent dehydrogenase
MNNTSIIKARQWMIRRENHVELEEFEIDLAKLPPRCIALRMHYSAVSPGTECSTYRGIDPDVHRVGSWCSYPRVPGYSGYGEIIACGSEVRGYAVGDLMMGELRHASHNVLPFDYAVARAPIDVDPLAAVYTRIFAIGMTPLRLIRRDNLATAGVWGLGIIGNVCAQMLALAGHRVIGIDPLASRRETARRCGIELTLDPLAPDFAARLTELTHGKNLGIAVDTTGLAEVTVGIPAYIGRRGQMVLMTHWRSQPPMPAGELIYQIFRKGLTLHGGNEGVSEGTSPGGEFNIRQRSKFERIGDALAAGRLQAAPLISHKVRPLQCREAYEGLCNDPDNWRGVVIDWRDEG